LVTSNGDTVRAASSPEIPGGPESVSGGRILEPGQRTESHVLRLLELFGVGESWTDKYLAAGSYQFFVIGMPSDTLTIRITEPTNESDVDAAGELIDALLSKNLWRSVEEQWAFYSDFYRSYPNSVYLQIALRKLLFLSIFTQEYADSLRANEYAYQLIKSFPESGYVREALLRLDVTILSEQQRDSLVPALSRIAESFPGSYLETLADSTLSLIVNDSR
jgi:hypothetical protein